MRDLLLSCAYIWVFCRWFNFGIYKLEERQLTGRSFLLRRTDLQRTGIILNNYIWSCALQNGPNAI